MPARIDFQTEPGRYRHWKLAFDGDVAELIMDVDENAGWAPAGTGLSDQANAYVGANRAGHFEGSESSEKCGPAVDTAVSVQS